MLPREMTFNILQSREVLEPWCLVITLKQHKKRIRADCEIVAEWVPNTSKLFKLSDIPVSYNKNLINYLTTIMNSYKHPLNEDDVKQINEELNFQKNYLKSNKRKDLEK